MAKWIPFRLREEDPETVMYTKWYAPSHGNFDIATSIGRFPECCRAALAAQFERELTHYEDIMYHEQLEFKGVYFREQTSFSTCGTYLTFGKYAGVDDIVRRCVESVELDQKRKARK